VSVTAAAGRRARAGTAIPAIVAIVAVLVLAAVRSFATWSLNRHPSRLVDYPAPRPHSSSPAAAAAVQLKPVSASSFDALAGRAAVRIPAAPYAIGRNASTAWHTSLISGYPAFGNLKKGTAARDMGKQVQLSQLTVQFGTSCCTYARSRSATRARLMRRA